MNSCSLFKREEKNIFTYFNILVFGSFEEKGNYLMPFLLMKLVDCV